MRHSKREFQKAHASTVTERTLTDTSKSKFRLTGLFCFCCNLANHRSKSSQKLKYGKCSQCSQCSAEHVHSNILKYSVSPTSSNLVQPPNAMLVRYRSQAQRHASAATRPSPTYGGPPDHPMPKLSNKTPREPES